MKTTALWFEAPEKLAIHSEELNAPEAGEVLVQAEYSAISSGSEMLLYRGLLPPDMAKDPNLPTLSGTMRYPVKYGYSVVGRIIDVGSRQDNRLLDKTVFLFHPHQSFMVVPKEAVFFPPDDIEFKDALFLPNMETAVSLVMDAKPMVGEKVVVLGQGVVGLLTTAILGKFPLSMLITVDPVKKRQDFSKHYGATHVFSSVDDKKLSTLPVLFSENDKTKSQKGGADLVLEVSGNPEALQQAIELAGFQARIVVGSWYGTKEASLQLGDRFHRNRLQIISSQVSNIHPAYSGRWSKKRRFELIWQMIGQVKPARLITHEIPFEEAERAYRLLLDEPESAIQVILTC
jgi:2-desacetyl-2-hydroxyethyl bacteriochlorophyllide A dehydrogenase